MSEPDKPDNQDQPEDLIEGLPPSEIDWRSCEDRQQRELLQKRIDTWMEETQKDVSELLEKKGIKEYQLSFLHKGTNSPMLMVRGGLFNTAKLAVSATNELRKQVAEQLQITS